jgi:hypothetical protein
MMNDGRRRCQKFGEKAEVLIGQSDRNGSLTIISALGPRRMSTSRTEYSEIDHNALSRKNRVSLGHATR